MMPPFSKCLLVAFAAFSLLGNATTRADSLAVKDVPETQRHALLIGLNYSWTLHPRIPYAHHSAHSLGIELQGYGYDRPYLLLGREASRDAIMNALERVASQCGADDELLVFFVGHGVRKINKDGSRVHALIPADCSKDTPSDELLFTRDVVRMLNTSPARNTALLLSACHSGQVIDDLTAIPWWEVRGGDRSKPRSFSVFAASSPNQLAFGNETETSGFFFDALIGGMREIAPEHADVVSAGDLQWHILKYLRKKTQGQQKPQFAQFGPNEFQFVRSIVR
jgi:hypothetical protein